MRLQAKSPSNGDSGQCNTPNFAKHVAPGMLVGDNFLENLLKGLRIREEKTFVNLELKVRMVEA